MTTAWDSTLAIWRRLGLTAQRQVVTTAVGLGGVAVIGPAAITSGVAWAGLVLLCLCTAVAIGSTGEARRRGRIPILVPVVCMVAIGLIRVGTGGPESMFGLLEVLPAAALGAHARRLRTVWLVPIATEIGALLYLVHPIAFEGGRDTVARMVSVPLVATIGAIAVNVLTRSARARIVAERGLRTAQTELLSRLREAGQAYASIVDSVTTQSIIATDRHGWITLANPGAQRLLGVDRDDLVSRHHVLDLERSGDDHLPADRLVAFREMVAQAGSRDGLYHSPTGTEVPVRIATSTRYDTSGGHLGYVFVATDISEEQRLAATKDAFVSLVSHELRTPLSSILGYLELVTDDEDHPLTDEQQQFLSVVQRNAERLLHIVGDLLFTAQVDAGRLTVTEADVDLAAIVGDSVSSAEPAAAAAGVELSVGTPESPVVVRGDAVRLGQAIDNLLSNAIKFTPRGGAVRTTLGIDGGEVRLAVRDSGIGIAADEVDRLTTRFFRATSATRSAVPGVGLGLHITRAIVTAHHGTLSVRSTEGVGTTLSVHLPVVRDEADEADDHDSSRSDVTTGSEFSNTSR